MSIGKRSEEILNLAFGLMHIENLVIVWLTSSSEAPRKFIHCHTNELLISFDDTLRTQSHFYSLSYRNQLNWFI